MVLFYLVHLKTTQLLGIQVLLKNHVGGRQAGFPGQPGLYRPFKSLPTQNNPQRTLEAELSSIRSAVFQACRNVLTTSVYIPRQHFAYPHLAFQVLVSTN